MSELSNFVFFSGNKDVKILIVCIYMVVFHLLILSKL